MNFANLSVFMYIVFFSNPPSSPLPLFPFCIFILVVRFSGNHEEFEDEPVDLGIVNHFVHIMASKWEKIGIQLKQQHLVQSLRQSHFANDSRCSQVIEAAIEAGHLSKYKVLLDILRSDGVGLSEVANDMLQAVVDESRSQREQEQQPTAAADSSSSISTDDTEASLNS